MRDLKRGKKWFRMGKKARKVTGFGLEKWSERKKKERN